MCVVRPTVARAVSFCLRPVPEGVWEHKVTVRSSREASASSFVAAGLYLIPRAQSTNHAPFPVRLVDMSRLAAPLECNLMRAPSIVDGAKAEIENHVDLIARGIKR